MHDDDEPPKKRTAAAWIKWVIGLPWKIEVQQIAKMTGRNRREVACILMEIWEWADSNADEFGNAPGVTTLMLNERVGVTGFAEAMAKAGWLLVDTDGVIFPNYERHNGNNAKKRAQTQKRVAGHRNR